MRLPYLHAVIIGRAVYPTSQVPFRVWREPFPTSMIYRRLSFEKIFKQMDDFE